VSVTLRLRLRTSHFYPAPHRCPVVSQ
jgi:hypothetical protein